MDDKLLTLPLQVQISLGAGYLAYLIAYAGIRQHHTATDAIFRSIAFGLAATAVMLWSPADRFFQPVGAVGLTVLCGAFWRWRGMRWAKTVLSKANVSWTDDLPSAWLSVTAQSTDLHPSQIAVDLDNGRTLFCDDTRKYADAPHGPCVFGLDGSIAMYVTAELKSDGAWVDIDDSDVRHPVEGDRLTYIPASAIKRIEVRYWSKINAKVVAEAMATEPAVAAEAPA